MSTEKKRLSLIKLPPGFLQEALLYSAEKRNQESSSASEIEPRKRLSFVKHSDKILEEAFQSSSKTEAYPKKYSADFLNQAPTRGSNISSKVNVTKNTYKIRSSIISRKSTSTKKDVQLKTINNINNFLYKTSRQEKLERTNIPQDIVDTVENVTKPQARKALFKIPAIRISTTHARTSRRILRTSRVSTSSNNRYVDQSPLMDIEKAEALLSKKSFLKTNFFNPLPTRKSCSPIVQEDEPAASPSLNGTTLENSNGRKQSSDFEFEAFEKLCNNDYMMDVKENIRKIHDLIREDKENFKLFKESHDKRIFEMEGLLNKLEACYKIKANRESKEEHFTPKKHSSKKTQVSTEKNRIPSNKAYDLRVNLLKSSIINSNKNATPKAQKAENMYNDLREKFDVLNTPKFERTPLLNAKKQISQKVQEQCILLLGTPKVN